MLLVHIKCLKCFMLLLLSNSLYLHCANCTDCGSQLKIKKSKIHRDDVDRCRLCSMFGR